MQSIKLRLDFDVVMLYFAIYGDQRILSVADDIPNLQHYLVSNGRAVTYKAVNCSRTTFGERFCVA